MNGYDIREESYTRLGDRSIACTLTLENGYEITGTYCIHLNELIHEDRWKENAFKNAYQEYTRMKNALDRQLLYTIS